MAIVASQLLAEALHALTQAVPFVVLRNYESLPLDWNNDVDILTSKADSKNAAEVLRVIFRRSTPRYEERVHFNLLSIRATCADRELQIDLYSAMSKGWMTYADTDSILRSRRRYHPLFETPEPLSGLLLIAAKELMAYGTIRPRYHQYLLSHGHEDARAKAHELFGRHMLPEGEEKVSSALSNPKVTGRPRMKMREVVRPLRSVRWAMRRLNDWQTVNARQ